ncbi:hypothetical protein [Aureivirga sp. CE67]|uniref:hypothetical protein n=1 Tax=Aureivirga sp. CE67 TaxID=1788983 RepID=UPI0018CB68D5|nr:hypothetical protein [Aureivirga sp. CE67]
MENLNLTGGVLIIGSLYWDKENNRPEWREKFLMKNDIKVKIPIRYGRKSSNDVFTMVFSKSISDNNFGTGYVKQLKRTKINNWNDLEFEVLKMAKAEGIRKTIANPIPIFKKEWCTMSILFNPRTINEEKKKFIIEEWIKRIEKDYPENDNANYKFGNEESVLNENYTLNFDWFQPTDEKDLDQLNNIDFLICSVTKQKNDTNNYPTTKEIVKSIKNDNKRYYFKNNRKYNISTFEDDKILENLVALNS